MTTWSWRRIVAPVVGLVVGLAGMVGVATPAAAGIVANLVSTGPLTVIRTGDDLVCGLEQRGQGNVWSTYNACGTVLSVRGTTYGPTSITPATPWTPVSHEPQQGDGSPGSPYTTVVVARAGSTGLEVRQTDSYVEGSQRYRTDLLVTNTSATRRGGNLARGVDCELPTPDRSGDGFGRIDADGSPTCVAASPADPTAPGTSVEAMTPLTAGSAALVDDRTAVWSALAGGAPLPGTCACDRARGAFDVAAALGWSFSLAPGAAATYSFETAVSPPPLVAALHLDNFSRPPGSATGFDVSISSLTDNPVSFDTFAAELPENVAYVPGSTTGASTAEPTIAGHRLTWAGPFALDADHRTAALHVGLRVRAAAAVGVVPVRVWGTVDPALAGTVLAATSDLAVGPLTVTSVSSGIATGVQDKEIALTGTLFEDSAQVTVSGSGVTVAPKRRVSSLDLRVSMSAAPDAPLGPRDVTVRLADGRSAVCPGCLVVSPPPSIGSVTPAVVGLGSAPTTLRFRGTGFQVGAVLFGTLSLNGLLCTPTGTTVLDCPISPDRTGVTGDFLLSLRNRDGGTTTTTVRVTPPPLISEVSPGTVAPGTSVVVTFTGSGFQPRMTAHTNLQGVTLGAPRAITPTSFTMRVTAARDAPRNVRPLVLTNVDHGSSAAASLVIG